ncbi:amino acid deaminase [Vibrio rumoiensis]|uniref:Amino acid deaminase n=1 Tax=Vibrio rumoiensis 1S-45 TaxID=1188252 RepID=A0A1E5E4W5_9VIBR|nr:amino acid deaminase [Vibrio rumoiensis]OEF27548.1 amino acid deaminase [Vibrio rumoiensis 1S-45]
MNTIGTKGIWAQENPQGTYSLINEEISLPAAVIKQSALTNNLNWMQKFADHHQVKLSPHGKTTMTADFFTEQLNAGAWGLTIATPAQAQVAANAGAENIIMANQLVGKANMAIIANLITEKQINYFCCVDSIANAQQLNTFFETRNMKLNVLIEMGVIGGRCGCRTPQEVEELAQFIADASALELHGIEVYEGVIHGDHAEQKIRDFLTTTINLVKTFKQQGLIQQSSPIITGAGSAWYDIVAETFSAHQDLTPIIRPGCYLIHDTGIYQDAQNAVMARAQNNSGFACELGGDLSSALEVWAYVISRPEAGTAIVGMGKRDVAFDAGLPIAEHGYRNGKAISIQGLTSIAVMDQHTFVTVADDCDLQVGDLIAFSTSHPCLTFDKWRYIAVCDDDYNVTRWVETSF